MSQGKAWRFDYDAHPESRTQLGMYAMEIEDLDRRTLQARIRIGSILNLILERHLKHGELMAFVEAECNISYRTASRYMVAAKRVAPIMDKLSNLIPSAVWILTMPSTPDSAWEEAMRLLRAGQRVTVEVAIRLRREALGRSGSPEQSIGTSGKPVTEPDPREPRDESKGEKAARDAQIRKLKKGANSAARQLARRIEAAESRKEPPPTDRTDKTKNLDPPRTALSLPEKFEILAGEIGLKETRYVDVQEGNEDTPWFRDYYGIKDAYERATPEARRAFLTNLLCASVIEKSEGRFE